MTGSPPPGPPPGGAWDPGGAVSGSTTMVETQTGDRAAVPGSGTSVTATIRRLVFCWPSQRSSGQFSSRQVT